MSTETPGSTPTTKRRPAQILLVVLALFALLGAASCSKTDDSTNTDTGGDTPSGTTATADDDDKGDDDNGDDDVEDDDSGSSSSSDDDDDSSSAGGNSASGNVTPGNEDFCDTLKEVATDLNAIDETAIADPAEMQKFFDQMISAYEQLIDVAPDEIKPDLELVVEAMRSENMNMLDPELEAAFTRLETWAPANCGFDPNDL